MKIYGYVYLTTNLINSKKYIGQHKAIQFEGCSYLGSGILLVEDIAKFGRENFTVELIEYCYSRKELFEKETYYIKKYNAVVDNSFYNLSSGDWAPKGHKKSPETIEKMRKPKTLSHRQNISKSKKGKTFEEIYGVEQAKKLKENLRKKHQGKIKGKYSKEHCKNISLGKLNSTKKRAPYSKITKKKMSDAAIGRPKPKIQCPYCNLIGGLPQMKRWHFNNCKHKH